MNLNITNPSSNPRALEEERAAGKSVTIKGDLGIMAEISDRMEDPDQIDDLRYEQCMMQGCCEQGVELIGLLDPSDSMIPEMVCQEHYREILVAFYGQAKAESFGVNTHQEDTTFLNQRV